MSGLVNRLKHWVGIEEECDEDDIYNELEEAGEEYQDRQEMKDSDFNTRRRQGLKVLTHPSSEKYEVMVIEPRSFDESLDIVNNLRDCKSIILNLHLLDTEQSQRVVDFLSGATHAIDGNQQRIGEGVFIFTPRNVAISAETEKARVVRDAFWNQVK